MYFVYILKSCEYQKSYIGITDDLERRLSQHNSRYYTYTKRYLPWEIIYIENFSTRLKAREREKYFKTSSGRRWLRNNVFKKI